MNATNKRKKKIRLEDPLRKDVLAGTALVQSFADVLTDYFYDDIQLYFATKYPSLEINNNNNNNNNNFRRKRKRKSIDVSSDDFTNMARLLEVSFNIVDWVTPPFEVLAALEEIRAKKGKVLASLNAYSCRFRSLW